MFALVGPLLSADTRARWKRLATMKKRRETLHEDLDFDSFDPRFRRTVEARDATPSSLANELRQMGALNQCTVVAIGHWAEPWQAPFEETLTTVLLTNWVNDEAGVRVHDNVVLVCRPGRLAFSQDDYADRSIIHRPH